VRGLGAAVVLVACVLGACGGQKGAGGGAAGARDEAVVVGPDGVATLAIHPLSRVDCTGATLAALGPAGAGGGGGGAPGCALLLHVDLRDGGDRPVRTAGTFRVELDPPEGVAEGASDAAKVWTVDVSDPRQNVAMYDGVITHTYALRLAGLPSWLEAWARSEGKAGDGDGPRVQVRLEAGGRVLEAERVLAR
jgi:hypothetical protein